jgi:hypothetical protein
VGNIDLLEHLNKFNMLNENFGLKVEEEDKAILLFASLPPLYDHLVMTLLYGKETLELEEVTRAFLLHETRRKPVNNQVDQLVVRSEPKCRIDKSKGKNDRGRKS